MPTVKCPDRETLRQFSTGLLPDEQSDVLVGHLETCADCQATIMSLEDAGDTLIGRLRRPPSSESCLAEPQFEAAMAAAIVANSPMPGTGPFFGDKAHFANSSSAENMDLSPSPAHPCHKCSANTRSSKSWAVAEWAASTRPCTPNSTAWWPSKFFARPCGRPKRHCSL